MNALVDTMNIYMLPPFLSLVMGIVLAVMSIVRGRLRKENILFSLLVLWWVMLCPVFLCHHLFRGDTGLLLNIERRVHFFYVFLPPLNLLFIYTMTGIRSRVIMPAAFALSSVLAVTTFTDYYFYGFYEYEWGYIAKGGPAVRVLELYGTVLVVYMIVFFLRRIRTEKNQIQRLKLKYILFSFILTGLFTMTNVPALNGIDVYPLSNMIFIPLVFLGYGVLSYRLMDVRSVLHQTVMWAVISSLIIVPNALAYAALYRFIIGLEAGALFAVASVWFYANYLYLRRVQPLIDQLFNKRKFDLHKLEAEYIASISSLKTTGELVSQFVDIITRALAFRKAELVICHPEDLGVMNAGTAPCDMEPAMQEWLVRANHLMDRDLVESKASYEEWRETMIEIFNRYRAQYLVPIPHMGRLAALLALPEKESLRQLKRYEVVFINNIRAAFSIALENAAMYSHLADLKSNLEQIVIERTSELTRTRDLLLQDIDLARKIQVALLPGDLPRMESAEIHYKYVPMMGVGGDFVDILPGPPGAVSFFICDVSGHGVSAALTASMVKMSLASWEASAASPARLLTNISASLKGKTGGNFITAASCHVNLESGSLVYANAGHPPVIILRSSGRVEFVRSRGRLISDFMTPNCEDAEARLEDNDIVILYTDGIIEERNDSEMFGENRFLAILHANRRAPVDALCNAVYNALIEFKGNAMLDDDFTILAMRYRACRQLPHQGMPA